VGLDGAFFLLRRLRSVQLRIIPRCGHLVSLEDPRTLGNTLRTFIESPGDSSAPDGAATGARVS
jgi:pimeloyl-ACP methyl ester carboxylesterase